MIAKFGNVINKKAMRKLSDELTVMADVNGATIVKKVGKAATMVILIDGMDKLGSAETIAVDEIKLMFDYKLAKVDIGDAIVGKIGMAIELKDAVGRKSCLTTK